MFHKISTSNTQLMKLFEFDTLNLDFNRTGRFSPTQESYWQQMHAISRKWRGCGWFPLVIVLGIYAFLIRVLFQSSAAFPQHQFRWILGGSILVLSCAFLLLIRSKKRVNNQFQDTEQRLAGGQLQSITGPVRITRIWSGGGQDDYPEYAYSLSIAGLGMHQYKLAPPRLAEAFGLSLPQKQSIWERLKRTPQVIEDPSRQFSAYYFEDGFGNRHMLSIEELSRPGQAQASW